MNESDILDLVLLKSRNINPTPSGSLAAFSIFRFLLSMPRIQLPAHRHCLLFLSFEFDVRQPALVPNYLQTRNWIRFSVLVISGEKRQLAYYNARSQTWTLLNAAGSCYDDLISHEGKFYAVDEYGKICRIDYSNLSVRVVFDQWFFGGNKVYLVCIVGQLLVIFRYLKENPYFGYETYNFQVFMLKLEEQEYSRIARISEFAIFLGQNHSTWLPADDTKGVIDDSIYFTDDHHSNGLEHSVIDGHDAGLYDMEYSRVVPLQCCNRGHLITPCLLVANLVYVG
ncbi:hypothetical protein EZV62_014981 [Acer yangbiense]|uniref:KIB1-4 beta-propeller domain-containing protein n=1 Tax=Acer yangbiense TaxID=1000413 RepID=A0A5C7HU79_9ROSI|nr:hypothetical protein EZV62_014981 [Acer yangbiense]